MGEGVGEFIDNGLGLSVWWVGGAQACQPETSTDAGYKAPKQQATCLTQKPRVTCWRFLICFSIHFDMFP